ncbi:MAG TPA: endolytic transglycosylase MltG [Gammaproteobacteria bacterium]|nr:endolytic transglycosylase MltG [Gammaproteobacteria bacterium]
MLGRLIVLFIILSVILGLITQNWLQNAETRVVTIQPRNITVANGITMRGFAEQLVQEGLLEEKWSFLFWVRYRNLSSSLKAGEYKVPADATMNDLLHLVTSGQVIDYPVTFIEGWNFKQLRKALAKQKNLRQTIGKMDDDAIMKAIGAEGQYPEGRFYPDTYHYTSTMTDLDILRKAYGKMKRLLNYEWEKRAPGLPLKNKSEALTLASIIEKETGAEIERPLIASVFINRLRKGMLLQTDPTVIYGMGDSYNGNIRRKDLRKDTPYNTYTRAGLPPTPIAMPGGKAIKAALHPALTDALYFVAKGDGTHYFSSSLREHNNAVNKYQINRRKNYSSSKNAAIKK